MLKSLLIKKHQFVKNLIVLVLFFFQTISSFSQDNFRTGKVLGSISVGNKEFSSVIDESTSCIHRTSAHSKNLFKAYETVQIITKENGDEIIKESLKERVYLISSNCNNSETTEVEEKKVYKAPTSPFPYCQKSKEGPIGGGEGYHQIFNEFNSDIVINTFNSVVNFVNTIENAPVGSIIYIDGNLTIDLSNLYLLTGKNSIVIPASVTIASNRGNGLGALILTNDFDFNVSLQHKGRPLFVAGGNNIRLTGIRFKGPFQGEGANLHPILLRYKSCVEVAKNYGGFEADNCTFYGWPYTAIRIGKGYNDGSFKKNRIHHCYFYNNKQRGYGYGVLIDYGFAKIYSNTFRANRHDIAGSGKKGSGYEASCNTILRGGTSHNFDMHAEGKDDGTSNAGRYINIHHNDFLDVGNQRYESGNDHNIFMRGRPSVLCKIENNRFSHDGPISSIKQSNSHGGYGNMLIWNNIYDKDDYLGWYVKNNWSKNNASNFINLPSTNDLFMNSPPFQYYQYAYNFGDFNGDGITDIYKLENGYLYTIPINSNFYTDWQVILHTGYSMSDLKFDFFNSDNKTDIIRQAGSTIYVSWGANTSWSPLLTTGYPLSNLKIGDFDGNGIKDLFLATGSVWRVSYNTNSNWQTINASGYSPNHLKLGWFNNNNRSDVFLANGSNFLVSYEGISSWTNTASSGYTTQQLSIGDFNGDNISDIIRPFDRKVSLSGNTTWKNCKTNQFPINNFTYGDF